MSGQQIGTGIGFIAGFFLPGGPQVWAGIGGMLGGWIAPTQFEGPRLTDGMSVTAQDGIPNPWGFGTFTVGCNVINAFDLQEHEETDDGKGSGQEQVNFTYTRSFALGICRAVRNSDGTYSDIAGVLRVTHNGKDVYNILPDATSEQAANNEKFLEKHKFYLGGESQMPDPTLEAYLGVGNVSAYRGQVYMVGTDVDQTQAQGAMGQWEFVVAMGGTATVSKAIALGRIDTPTTRSAVYNSEDGSDWDSALDPNDISGFPETYISPLGDDAYVVWNISNAYVTHDDGATWSGPHGSFGSAGGQRQSHCAGSVLIIPPNSSNDLFITYDGENYAEIGTGITGALQNAASNNDTLMVSYVDDVTGNCWCSTAFASFPLSWTAQSEVPIYAYGDHWLTCNQETFALGGQSSNVSPKPVIAYSHNDGLSWSASTLSASDGTNAKHVHPGANEMWVALIDNGEIWYSDDDCETWAESASSLPQTPTGLTWNGAVFMAAFGPSGSGGIWTSPTGEVWTSASDPFDRVYLIASRPPVTQSITPDATALGDIVAEVCRRSGLTSSDIDVSQLPDVVKGFKVASEVTGETVINSLMVAKLFDAAEYDDKLRFIKRGGAPVFDLQVADLAERDGPLIEQNDEQEVELLRKVSVRAMDPDAGYIETSQSWERRANTVVATGSQTVLVPLVMTANEQKQLAQMRVRIAWSEPHTLAWNLPYTIPGLTPADVGTITDKFGRTQLVRLERMTLDSGIIEVREARITRQSAYGSTAAGINHGQRPTTTPQPPGPTFFWAGNLPSLRTSDNTPGMYIAAAGYQSAWAGSAILLSTDDGASFQRVADFPTASTMGSLTGDITESGEPIPVFMNSGSLNSATDDQLADRHNGFAITTDGVSEIGQFKTATLGSPRNYELTDTLRGGLNTDAAEHGMGDPFVLVSTALFLPIDISHAGKTLIFKAVSYGTSADDAAEYPVVYMPLFTSVVIETYVNDVDETYVDGNGSPYYRMS